MSERTIRIQAGALPRQVEQALDALAVGDAELYQRAGELVTIGREPDRDLEPLPCEGRDAARPCARCAADAGAPCHRDARAGSSIMLRPGTPRVMRLTPAVLTLRMARAATWIRPKPTEEGEPEWIPADPPGKVAKILSEMGDYPGVRAIRGIIEAPSLRPDGTVIDRAGYDRSTGLVYLPGCVFPEVPSRPTREEGCAALRRLWLEVFSDFPFQGMGERGAETSDEDRFKAACGCPDAFVGIAALLTVLGRAAIGGAAPAAIFEAAAQGSGKTLQMHVTSIIATGRAAGVMTFPMSSRGGVNEEELEKVLSAYALSGALIIAFDNVKGSLGGPALEKCLTAEDRISLRVLGASDRRDLPWIGTVMVTGNNMTMTDDVAQRSMVSRLESPREDPRARPDTTFRHPDLLGYVRAHRASLLVDALTVLRAFLVASPAERASATCGSWGSFPAWAKLIAPAIRFAGGPNVLRCRPRGEMGQDEAGEAHSALMRYWPTTDPIGARDLVARAFDHEYEIRKGSLPPDNLDEFRGAIRTLTNTVDGKTPNPIVFGKALGRLRGKIRGEYKLVADRTRTGVCVWRVECLRREPDAAPDSERAAIAGEPMAAE